MKVFLRIISVIAAICVPVAAILGASNLILRLPDLYTYEFRSKQIVREINLSISDDELGQFFSDYMKGKNEEFDLIAEYRNREQAVFGPAEQLNMENARRMLNHTAFILGISAVLIIASYWILLNKKRKTTLRMAFKGGVAIFAALQISIYVLFFNEKTRSFFYDLIFINSYEAEDALPLILTQDFAKLCIYANFIVSAIFMLIFFSITWNLSRPRRMFR
ncbi:MAG: DUF1461 domain-containing protein [Anaerovoracaceae bacterium]|nr:hypothetical protein [Clostridiales bacterium]